MKVVVAIASGLFIGIGAAIVLFALLVWPLRLAADWSPWLVWSVWIGLCLLAGLSSFGASLRNDRRGFRLW
jgi:hypothetical protein